MGIVVDGVSDVIALSADQIKAARNSAHRWTCNTSPGWVRWMSA